MTLAVLLPALFKLANRIAPQVALGTTLRQFAEALALSFDSGSFAILAGLHGLGLLVTPLGALVQSPIFHRLEAYWFLIAGLLRATMLIWSVKSTTAPFFNVWP